MHKHERVQGNLACIAFSVMVLKMNSGQSLGHPVYQIRQLCLSTPLLATIMFMNAFRLWNAQLVTSLDKFLWCIEYHWIIVQEQSPEEVQCVQLHYVQTQLAYLPLISLDAPDHMFANSCKPIHTFNNVVTYWH